MVAAANQLTEGHPDRLVSVQPVIDQLRTLGAQAEPDALATDLLTLAAKMDTLKLGTARIHLRLNAEQIRTVISRDIGLETEHRALGRIALNKLSQLARPKAPLDVNFADLFLEQSPARRQFIEISCPCTPVSAAGCAMDGSTYHA